MKGKSLPGRPETRLGATNTNTLNKLVVDRTAPNSNDGQRHVVVVDPLSMRQVSDNTAQNTIDASSIMEVLPDMEHVVQILIGTIQNPKDMSQSDLNIVVDDTLFNSEVSRPLLEIVTEYFKKTYKMDDRQDLVLEEMIAKSGAYIQAILPENSLDSIINGPRTVSNEEFDRAYNNLQAGRSLGILGVGEYLPNKLKKASDGKKVSVEDFNPSNKIFESVFGDTNLTVSDNFTLLRLPQVNSRRRERMVSSLLKREMASLEDYRVNSTNGGLTPDQISQLYRSRDERYNQTIVVERPEAMTTPSYGHPLPIDLPSTAVIPAYVPGKPHEHVGYFVLIDRYGRPVTYEGVSDHYNKLRNNFNSSNGGGDNSSEMLRITREALGATANTQDEYSFERLHQSYNSIVEADLKKRLLNGTYREEFDLGFTDEIRRIMFTRQLKNQQTQLIYIPESLVIYNAFTYDKNGVGVSMLAKSKILANMRSVLLFAETMAGVRNAVGRKKVNINLDPNDPDKSATVSEIQQLVVESGRRGFPIGAPDPSHTLDYLNRAGYDFSINANDEDFHQMSVEYDDYNTNIQAGNPELQERLKKMHYSAMACPPEKVDPSNGADFAQSIIQNDILMARRVRNMQKAYTAGLTKTIQVYTLNSSILVNKMLDVIKDNPTLINPEYKEKDGVTLVEDFIRSLIVKLPEPDTTRIELLTQQLDQYEQLLTKVLDNYITTELFDDSYFAKQGGVDKAIAVIKAHYMRQYIASNSILPEVGELYAIENDKPYFNLFDIQETGIKSLGTAIQEYVVKLEAQQKEWAAKYGESSDGFGAAGDDGFADDNFQNQPDEFDTQLENEPEVEEPISDEPETEVDLDGEQPPTEEESEQEGSATDTEEDATFPTPTEDK